MVGVVALFEVVVVFAVVVAVEDEVVLLFALLLIILLLLFLLLELLLELLLLLSSVDVPEFATHILTLNSPSSVLILTCLIFHSFLVAISLLVNLKRLL